MPLFLLPFLIGGGLGFGGGFFAADGFKTLTRIAVIGGVGYVAVKWINR